MYICLLCILINSLQFQFLQDLENLRPIIDRISNGKPLRSSSTIYNKFYSIEEIKLY